MKKKLYLDEFLDELSKMIEGSKTNEQKNVCINYIKNYKLQLQEVISNELFKNATLNFLDELIKEVDDEMEED